MRRILILVLALFPILAGCAGAYVAGDVGPHRDNSHLGESHR